jgi:predicted ATPase
LRRSAFQEAIAHLGKAIEMADKAEGGSGAEPTAALSRSLKLQTDYGHALILLKGFASDEAKVAFARARELADGTKNTAELFAAYWPQWVRSFILGEHRFARETALTFLRNAEDGGFVTEAIVARRMLGTTCLYQGDFMEARVLLDQALADYLPDRDVQARFRFGNDIGVAARVFLALTIWHLGEGERARQLAEEALQSAVSLGHVPTRALAYSRIAILETQRNDPAAALPLAEMLLALAREHGMDYWVAIGEIVAHWAHGRLYDPETGADKLRRALTDYLNKGNRVDAPRFHGLLAELEAATKGLESALSTIDQGLAIAEDTGEDFTDPYLHRLRGDVLLQRDPANVAPAEEAYRTAIAVAREQGAPSHALLAALSFTKLCHSTGRPTDAHAVLAPALEGFSPTPEMPEITEAQALMERLALGPMGGRGFPLDLARPALRPTERKVTVLAPKRVERWVFGAP